MTPTLLPDDIEQKLLAGQRLRATHDLIERRGITLTDARMQIGRWLLERQQNGMGPSETEGTGNPKPEPR
jgi:hypothetical protein